MRFPSTALLLLSPCGGTITNGDGSPSTNTPDAGSWSPSSLHLALWLEESGIEGSGALSVWRDHSGTNNDAVAVDTPVIEPQLLNGHTGVRATPGGFVIQDTSAIRWGTKSFMIGAVLRWSPSNATLIYDRSGPCTSCSTSGAAETIRLEAVASAYDATRMYAGVILQAADGWVNPHPQAMLMPIATFHIVVARGNTPLSLRVDDTVSTGPDSDMNLANAVQNPVVVFGLDADVAELVVATDTTDADEASLVAYFKAKFAL